MRIKGISKLTQTIASTDPNAIAKRAFEMMIKNGVPLTPQNFSVWFAYCSGEHPELAEALGILIDSEAPIEDDTSDTLYKRFCATPLEAVPLKLIAEHLETEIAVVISCVADAGQSANEYGDTLKAVTDALSQVRKAPDLQEMLGRMLNQTRAMVNKSDEVEKQLRDSWSEISRLREQLEGARREAMTDSLTSIANRKMFDYVLRDAAMAAMEYNEQLSLLFIDIDKFKDFNDRHGHATGDQVLKLLASVLRDMTKGQDTPARHGGEEFAVILPNTDLDGAVTVADSIRQRIASKRIVHRKTGEALTKITVSIGVSQFKFGEPVKDFVERADEALYKAKRVGRNCVIRQEEVDRKPVALQN
jgi:diguanylate cyclase